MKSDEVFHDLNTMCALCGDAVALRNALEAAGNEVDALVAHQVVLSMLDELDELFLTWVRLRNEEGKPADSVPGFAIALALVGDHRRDYPKH